jgi:hypothetical protein
MRLRFSLRWLFLATMAVAVACCWLVFPTINAQSFARAVAVRNFERADSYFRYSRDRFLLKLNDKYWRFHAQAELEPLSLSQLLRGQRLLKLYVAFGDAGPMRSQGYAVLVTRAGMLSPSPMIGGAVGGMGIARTTSDTQHLAS